MSRKRARRLANARGNDKQKKLLGVLGGPPAARITTVLSLKYSSHVGRAHTLSFLYYEIGGAHVANS
jgi:hypothetical protein